MRVVFFAILIASFLLLSCKSYVVITGHMDDYRDGGLLCARSPENPHLPDVRSDDWYEQFLGQRVQPDTFGKFNVRVPLRRMGVVRFGEYNSLGRAFLLWPGDTVHVLGRLDSIRYSNPKSAATNALREEMRQRALSGAIQGKTGEEIPSGIMLRGVALSLGSRSLGAVDSLRLLRTVDSARSAERSYYDSALRAAGVGRCSRKRLTRWISRRYYTGSVWFPDSVRPLLPEGNSDMLHSHADAQLLGKMKPGRSDRYYDWILPWYSAAHRASKRNKPISEREELIRAYAHGNPLLPTRAMRNQDAAVSYFEGWRPRQLDTLEWAELLRLRHRAFGGTLLDSLVQDAGSAYLLQRRWGDSPRRKIWGELHHLDTLWKGATDRRPILLWAWVVGDTTGLRGLAKRIAAEREVSRIGVRVVYVCFNDRDFNLRMDMWGMGLRGEYASAMGQARRELLWLFGVREYRRSRFALLTHDGKLLDGELPLPQEGEKILGRIRELLARHDGEMVEE